MLKEKPNFTLQEWENIPWEATPYKGVFLHKVEEEPDPSNPNTPLLTVMALKVEPQAIIPLHRHKRNIDWTETICLPNGGFIETENGQESKQIKTENSFTVVIQAGEIFGLKNLDSLKPLYFFSRMQPGFTGYREIEGIKQGVDSPA